MCSKILIANMSILIFFVLMERKAVASTSRFTSSNLYYETLVRLKLDRIEGRTLSLRDCQENFYLSTLKSCQLALHSPQLLYDISHNHLTHSLNIMKTNVMLSAINHKRKKRSLETNPCNLHPIPTTSVILHAQDSQTSQVFELVQDPISGIFQTFFTYSCTGTFNGYACSAQFIDFLSLVFTGIGNQVEVRRVMVPTHCAVTTSNG